MINISEEHTANTDTSAAICMELISCATDAIVLSCDEKSILPNAIAMFKNVNNGPKPVKIVETDCINL